MRLFITFTLSLLVLSSFAQRDFSKVQIKKTEVTDNIYMLQGAGGNIGLYVSEDGVMMIDAQYAPLSEKLQNAVKEIADQDIKFVLNTHWHFDHTGGNENFANGSGSIIVAHENVRKRLTKDHFNDIFKWDIKAAPKKAWPVITFTDSLHFFLGDEEIQIFHGDNAHTDGDAVVYFKTSNVIHTGDVFVRYGFPFIDITVGGSIDGMIALQESILSQIDDDTKIIPGHGQLSSKKDLEEVLSMLKTTRNLVAKAKKSGKSLDETLTASPLKDFHERWNGSFISTDLYTQFVYETLD